MGPLPDVAPLTNADGRGHSDLIQRVGSAGGGQERQAVPPKRGNSLQNSMKIIVFSSIFIVFHRFFIEFFHFFFVFFFFSFCLF